MATGAPEVLSFPTPKAASRIIFEGLPTSDSPLTEAARLTRELKELDQSFHNGYIRAGLICMEVRDGRLWEPLGFDSFNDWLMSSAPYSRAHCYQSMKDIAELSEIGHDDLLKIATSNLPLLKRLSSAVRRDPTVLRAASEMPSEAFTGWVVQNHPLQHQEARTPRKLPASLWVLLDQCVEKAMREQGFVHRDDAIEYILSDFLISEPCDSAS
jgi:hypothetical protein